MQFECCIYLYCFLPTVYMYMYIHYQHDSNYCYVLSPLTSDPSLIPQHLIPVFRAITGDWEVIGGYPIVPRARAVLFREKFSVHDLPTEAATYFALYHEDPSWKWLARRLYRAGETAAVELAKPHIQTVTGGCGYTYMYMCT